MTEGTPPPPDQPQYPDQPPQPGQPSPPPYGGSFGQPGQPQPPVPPPYGRAEPPAYTPQEPSVPAQGYGEQSSPYGQPAHPGQPPRDPDKRPGTVLAAAIVTWVFAALALLGAAIMLFGISADRDTVVDEIEQDEAFQDIGWSGDEFVDALNLISIVTIVLSLVAIVLAVVAFQRSNGGRIALVVLSAVTALITLAGSLFCLPALWLVASVATIVLLFTGGASDWYARRAPGQPAYPQPGDYGQWPQA